MENNADKILFRASSSGYLMVEPKLKSEVLSETTKTHLVDVFVSNKYGRNTDIHTKATNKGLMVEEDSLTLYSRYKKEIYFKNEEHFSNDFIKGTPDIILEDMIIDIKSSWDIYTFFRSGHSKLNKLYYWQLQSYMALTGKKEAMLAYCLINTPDMLIQDEKRRLQYKMGVIDDANLDFQKACDELDRLMIYDDIQMNEKVMEIHVKRNDSDIERLYERVQDCREYMNEYLFKCYPEPTE
jgi:hypothetical protein